IDHRHSVSVAGVIVDDQGRALIIRRRDNGHWEPPGGILEHGETIEAGLRREVYEETRLKIEPGQLTGVYQNIRRHIIALVFRARPVGGQLMKNDEATAFRWATSAEVPSLMSAAFATRVLDALTLQSPPSIRTHDGTHLVEE